jgi:hypothetical protein
MAEVMMRELVEIESPARRLDTLAGAFDRHDAIGRLTFPLRAKAGE